MKKITILSLLVLVTTLSSFAQEGQDSLFKRWSFGAEIGLQEAHDESATSLDNTYNLGLEARYNFTPKFGLGLTGGFYDLSLEDDYLGIKVNTNYYRVNVEGTVNLSKAFNLKHERFVLLGHAGPGLSWLSTDLDYKETFINLRAGLTGEYLLWKNVALKADWSVVGNTEQKRNIGGVHRITNTGINSTLNCFSVGVNLSFGGGKKSTDKNDNKRKMKHADWYVAPTPIIIQPQVLRDTIIIREIKTIIYRDTCKIDAIETKYVFFENDKAELKEGNVYYVVAMASIYDGVDKMKEDSSLIVKIRAWESPTLEIDDSKDLSLRRAKIVKAKFESMGIVPERIFIEPNGKDFDSKKNLEMGRRVGFTIVKN